MDQQWVIRQDLDPFPARALINYNVFAILRCTLFKCPYCSWPFKVIWGQEAAFLGRGERACWHCGQKFWDNSQEWPEMSGSERRLFLLPISVAGWLAGTLVVGGLMLFPLGMKFKFELLAAGVIILALLLPLLFWFVFRGWQIIRSVRRYNQRAAGNEA